MLRCYAHGVAATVKIMLGTKKDAALLPAPISRKVAKLAADRECPLGELLAELVELGLREIDRKLAAVAASDALADLSARQRDVLQCLRDGLAVKEIGDKLNISEVTVRTHIYRIRERLDCADLLGLRIPDRR